MWAWWRPMKYKKVEDIQPLIDKYIKETPKDELTITWLAYALDTSRSTLMDYEWRDEFSYTIKKRKNYIEMQYEIDLRKKGNSWTIFALKNFNWKDQSQVDTITKQINFDAKDMSDEELDKLINE